jgi:hypothetical protein
MNLNLTMFTLTSPFGTPSLRIYNLICIRKLLHICVYRHFASQFR